MLPGRENGTDRTTLRSWEKSSGGVDGVTAAIVDRSGDGVFKAQFCNQNSVIAVNQDADAILTPHFSGCALFMARLGSMDIVGHFDKPGDPNSYEPLARMIIANSKAIIENAIIQSKEYQSLEAGKQQDFIDTKESQLLKNLCLIYQQEIVGDVLPDPLDLVVYPKDFSLCSGGIMAGFAEPGETMKTGFTTAMFIRQHSGQPWHKLVQVVMISRVFDGKTPDSVTSLALDMDKRFYPLELTPLLSRALNAIVTPVDAAAAPREGIDFV